MADAQPEINPQIDFRHVLTELAVNRKDPCEVLRELISNSYDAGAKTILYFPILQNEGFVFFDDGDGLDQTKKIRGITPYNAFFSIGKSTKTFGTTVGYKCQGTKLCFASSRFALITRCSNEERWRFKSIENPKHNLEISTNVSPVPTATPWESLGRFLGQPDERTEKVLEQLTESFFFDKFKKGTMIITLGLEVDNFSAHYNPGLPETATRCYLYNYIRFCTKHGDVRLISRDLGFRPDAVHALTSPRSSA